MPPSPSPRRSRKGISYERGHSFGSILPAKSKDDELTLFTDMQKHERDNFLLESAEDFDESISKLSYFRDLKLGVNIAARGEHRDLLNVDGERNDYDWLLTPPETPLFPSLDDEEDQRISMAHRGRAQIKPISVSRSSTMENTRRSNRSSASPSRLSPSPRSCSSTVLTRTRSSNSSSQCSTPLALQPATPSRRSSTPPASKTSTPPRRSPSPASRRMSTGSSDPISKGRRGSSPVKPSQRSSSPKLQGCQSSDPGFSFDAPPNLRTSLLDRSVSRSRGGSPSSFSGLDVNWRGRRQSMSPTPSRRASSSHSNDRDRFSSYSKASAASSAEDDESMQSIPISYSSSPPVRKNLSVMKSRTIASPKKPSKSFYPSSAPKRSFDSAVWLMDQRKAPQDKFRPLLSSVPSTTFGAVKGDNVQSSMLSHNSPLMTSSNLSSEHGITFDPSMGNYQYQSDVVSECEATPSSVIHEDISMFDKLDALNEEPSCNPCSLSTTQSGPESPSILKYAEGTIEGLELERSRISQTSCNIACSSEVGHTKMATCIRCGKLFSAIEDDGEVDFCEECALVDEVPFVDPKIQTLEEAHGQEHKVRNSKPCLALEAPHISPDCIEDIKKLSLDNQLLNDEPQAGCLHKCPESKSTMDTTDRMLSRQHGEDATQNLEPHDIGNSLLGKSIDMSSHQCSVSECQQKEPASVVECDILRDQTANHHNEVSKCLAESLYESIEFVSDTLTTHKMGSVEHLNLKDENTEGAGISVLLLQKSTSNKLPVVEGRPLAATNILCSEPYYSRDRVSTLKRTIGWDSSSAASSIDQGSSRKSVHCERLKSSNCYDFEKSQISSTISCQSIASMSDVSISNCSVSICPRSNAIVDTGFLTDNSESSRSRTMICTEEYDESCKCTPSSAVECWSAAKAIVNDDIDSFGDAIQNQSTGGMAHKDDLSANSCSLDTETHSNIPLSLAPKESCIQKTEEGTSAITQCCSVGTSEHPDDECGIDNYQMQYEAVPASNEANRLDDGCVSVISEEDVLISATDASTVKLPSNEESVATLEGSRKQIQRCFTLEEATDTILFCRSIAHDIAYKAATIGLEREYQSEHASAPRPTVTVVGQSIPRGDNSLKPPHRRMPRHRKLSGGGTVTETAKMEVVAKDPVPVQSVPEFSRTSDSMKPPKIESKCNCAIM